MTMTNLYPIGDFIWEVLELFQRNSLMSDMATKWNGIKASTPPLLLHFEERLPEFENSMSLVNLKIKEYDSKDRILTLAFQRQRMVIRFYDLQITEISIKYI
jgi:hypothetical protein